MKKLILTLAVIGLLSTVSCKKLEIVDPPKSKCATISKKVQKHVVRDVYYYYFYLSDGQEILVSEAEFYKWSDGAIYSPKCVQ
jgi:hypothetical protein